MEAGKIFIESILLIDNWVLISNSLILSIWSSKNSILIGFFELIGKTSTISPLFANCND